MRFMAGSLRWRHSPAWRCMVQFPYRWCFFPHSQAPPRNALRGGSASRNVLGTQRDRRRGGASLEVRYQAEPGNENFLRYRVGLGSYIFVRSSAPPGPMSRSKAAAMSAA